MENRLAPGGFFNGEILDIDHQAGGFNSPAAFSSGRLAGERACPTRNLPARAAKMLTFPIFLV